jgi:hypothetical protein
LAKSTNYEAPAYEKIKLVRGLSQQTAYIGVLFEKPIVPFPIIY